MRIAAIDIGGTYIKSALCKDAVLGEISTTPTRGWEGASALLTRVSEIALCMGDFDAVGICTRGQVNCDTGTIIYDPPEIIPGYTGMCISDALSALGKPVYVENDVNCAGLGEAVSGVAHGYESVLCLTYGTAVGGAIIENGQVRHGANWSAGEFGMMYTNGEFYEDVASVSALVRAAASADAAIRGGRSVVANAGRPEIAAILSSWTQTVALGIASLVHIFDPHAVVLGGGIMEDTFVFGSVKRAVMAKLAPGYHTDILMAAHGNKAGLLGAAINCESIERQRLPLSKTVSDEWKKA